MRTLKMVSTLHLLGLAAMLSRAFAIPSAADAAAKWQRNASNAAGDYAAGIQRVTENPLEKAARAADTWQMAVSDQRAKTKFARKLRAYPFEQWKSIASQFGQQRYSQGVQSKQAQFEAAIGPVLAFEANLQNQVKQLPNATLADRRARMNAWFDGMSNFGQ